MNDAKLYSVIRAPRVSEKTARLQEISNQYAFEVAKTATKADIKSAVEQIFSVEVQAVNVVNVKGKNKAFRNRQGTRGDWRKAYVTLDRKSVVSGQSVSVRVDLGGRHTIKTKTTPTSTYRPNRK